MPEREPGMSPEEEKGPNQYTVEEEEQLKRELERPERDDEQPDRGHEGDEWIETGKESEDKP